MFRQSFVSFQDLGRRFDLSIATAEAHTLMFICVSGLMSTGEIEVKFWCGRVWIQRIMIALHRHPAYFNYAFTVRTNYSR